MRKDWIWTGYVNYQTCFKIAQHLRSRSEPFLFLLANERIIPGNQANTGEKQTPLVYAIYFADHITLQWKCHLQNVCFYHSIYIVRGYHRVFAAYNEMIKYPSWPKRKIEPTFSNILSPFTVFLTSLRFIIGYLYRYHHHFAFFAIISSWDLK